MPQDLKIHQPDDRFFKSAMSDPEVAKSYVQHFYPEIAHIADFESLRLESNSSIRPSLKQFEADVIYRCRFKGEEDAHFYFCLLFEHKSEPDKHVAVQIGLYIMELLYSMVKKHGKKLEPVLPLVFYNGEKKWVPKTLAELFDGHPYQATMEPYIPNFRFLFQDASRLSTEELLCLDLSYFRSALMAMAFRHRQHLIFQYIQAIFEGTVDKEEVSAVMTYILGVGERSEEAFLEALKNKELTVKPEVMSTLEQILERGRKEGREEGLYKKSIFNLLKTALRFPALSMEELSDFTEIESGTVRSFLQLQSQGDAEALQKYVREGLLADIPLSAEEEEKLVSLAEELTMV
jgi:predicted transposase/invertase (TIGR01784 family)